MQIISYLCLYAETEILSLHNCITDTLHIWVTQIFHMLKLIFVLHDTFTVVYNTIVHIFLAFCLLPELTSNLEIMDEFENSTSYVSKREQNWQSLSRQLLLEVLPNICQLCIFCCCMFCYHDLRAALMHCPTGRGGKRGCWRENKPPLLAKILVFRTGTDDLAFLPSVVTLEQKKHNKELYQWCWQDLNALGLLWNSCVWS